MSTMNIFLFLFFVARGRDQSEGSHLLVCILWLQIAEIETKVFEAGGVLTQQQNYELRQLDHFLKPRIKFEKCKVELDWFETSLFNTFARQRCVSLTICFSLNFFFTQSGLLSLFRPRQHSCVYYFLWELSHHFKEMHLLKGPD